MCAFAEYWWVFLAVCVVFAIVLIMLPVQAEKAGLISGAICIVCIVLLIMAGSAKSDLKCKELKYQVVIDKRQELVRECPDRDKPGCQLKWVRYQKDSLIEYLHVLQ